MSPFPLFGGELLHHLHGPTPGFGSPAAASNDFNQSAAFANAVSRAVFDLNPIAVAEDSAIGRSFGRLTLGNGGSPKSFASRLASLHIVAAAASRTWHTRSRPSVTTGRTS